MSDFTNLKQSGSACVGCGKTSDQALLRRLNTYSRSFCCYQCHQKHRSCAGEGSEGKVCNHEPHSKGPCAHCGCPTYRHGLESDLDRMYADCVGKAARVGECTGYGTSLGKCGTIIFAKPDGSLPRLCEHCERNWMSEVIQGSKEVAALMDIDPEKVEMPN